MHVDLVMVRLSMKGDFFMSKFVACFNRLTQLLYSILRLKFQLYLLFSFEQQTLF